MSISRASEILALARDENDRLRRHLLVASALSEALPSRIAVVGGIAEDYWAADEYHPTDLDVTGDPDPGLLAQLGFVRTTDHRHWWHAIIEVEVEFPVGVLEGEWDRVTTIDLGEVAAEVIGVEDIYLDRLRQTTGIERDWETSPEFIGARNIAAVRWDVMDWGYVEKTIEESGEILRDRLRPRNSRVRSLVVDALDLEEPPLPTRRSQESGGIGGFGD